MSFTMWVEKKEVNGNMIGLGCVLRNVYTV